MLDEELIRELYRRYPPLLTQRQLSEITGQADSTLEQARLNGGGIPFVRLGRNVRYPLDCVVQYLVKLPRFQSTAEKSRSDVDPAERRNACESGISLQVK